MIATADPYSVKGPADYYDQARAPTKPTPRNKKAFDETRLRRLGRSMQWSRLKLLPFREQRLMFVREYLGKWYGDTSQIHARNPINWLEMTADTYAQRLAARNPQVAITTLRDELKPSALELETGTNYLLGKINLQRELKKVVKDAIFLLGILKVGICRGEYTTFEEESGEPFARRVSFDDWVHDIFAHEYEECSFAGNHYILTLDQVRENPGFDKQAREAVQPQVRTSYNEQGDQKVSTMGPGMGDMSDADLYDTVALWDIWLPREKLVVTITADQSYSVADTSKVLRVVEWEGPEFGPYHLLSYYPVPDNVMPLSLSAMMYDSNRSFNLLFNKMMDQATRQKKIGFYRGSASDDANRITNAKDGEWIRVDDPTGTNEHDIGGPNQQIQALLLQLKSFVSEQAGNLELLAGLDPQSKTVGQDKLLAGNAGARLGEMQDTTVNFANGVIRDLAWYLFSDPLIDLPLVKEIGGGVKLPFKLNREGLHGPFELSKAEQTGQFLDYNFKIAPHSMQPKTPEEQLQVLGQYLQLMQPFVPMMQQQGMQFDLQGISREFAKLADMHQLDNIVQFSGPDQTNTQMHQPVGQAPPKMAAQTERTHVRINKPGGTQGGQDAAMIAHLSGLTKQPAEQARMAG